MRGINMETYAEKLKESLITLHLGVLDEYCRLCAQNGNSSELIDLSNVVVDFLNLCNQARNYYDNTRKQMDAYHAGGYSVTGDQTTSDYLEKTELRYDILLSKVQKSCLSSKEQSTLLANIVLEVGNFGNGYFGYLPNSQDFLAKMISDLDDSDFIVIYNKLNGIKYAYISSIKSIADKRGLEVKKAKKSGGCYVATCVYGSYDCPEVWTLRRFRDDILSKNFFGRLFIKCYYAVSPTAVKLFGGYLWFHKLFKAPLDKLVVKLQKQGVENTPYNDK